MNTTLDRPLDPPRDTPKPALSPELASLAALLALADELESAARAEGCMIVRPSPAGGLRAACARTDAARDALIAALTEALPLTIGGAR